MSTPSRITMCFEGEVTDAVRTAFYQNTPFGLCVGIDCTGRFGKDFDKALEALKAAEQAMQALGMRSDRGAFKAVREAIAELEGSS